MQNLNEIQIFYKPGQTQLTQMKHDPDDPIFWFQTWPTLPGIHYTAG